MNKILTYILCLSIAVISAEGMIVDGNLDGECVEDIYKNSLRFAGGSNGSFSQFSNNDNTLKICASGGGGGGAWKGGKYDVGYKINELS